MRNTVSKQCDYKRVFAWQELFYLIIGTCSAYVLLQGYLYVNLTHYGNRWYTWAHLALAIPIAWSSSALGVLVMLNHYLWRWWRGRYRMPVQLILPALVALSVVVVFPFLFQIRLAFGDLRLETIAQWREEGSLGFRPYENFANVLWEWPLQNLSFFGLLIRTILWTLINVSAHVFFGLGIALLLHQPIRAKGLFRALLIVPWAMPQVISVLAWRGEFHPQFGLMNQLLNYVGLPSFDWWSDPFLVFLSCCIVNIWLGIPFMIVVFLSGLEQIPQSLYEAARLDGASWWYQFRKITVPLLYPVVIPSVTLGFIWTFNNVNVIYLMTGQENEYADILVSVMYKSAFIYSRYSYSAALAVILFVGLAIVSHFASRRNV